MEITLDFTDPDARGWMDGDRDTEEDWCQEAFGSTDEQIESVAQNYVDAIVELAGCSEAEARHAIESVGEETFVSWRERALTAADEEGVYGLGRYRAVQRTVAELIIEDESTELRE